MKQPSFLSIVVKTIIVHSVTYFIVGFVSFTVLDYTAKYADPTVSLLMRPTNDPWVAGGPLFQPLRGLLFGFVFYALREIVLARKQGWLILWLTLAVVGILAPFTAAPSSIEGALYTRLPLWFHAAGLPEVVVQALLLAFLTHYWVNHPEKKWLGWVFGVVFVVVLLMSALGVVAGLGMLPTPA